VVLGCLLELVFAEVPDFGGFPVRDCNCFRQRIWQLAQPDYPSGFHSLPYSQHGDDFLLEIAKR
jgi:hypothetical protein